MDVATQPTTFDFVWSGFADIYKDDVVSLSCHSIGLFILHTTVHKKSLKEEITSLPAAIHRVTFIKKNCQ